MIFASGFFKTIILLGALQGIIVSCLLFFLKKNRQKNRLLAALIFLMALASFNLYANYENWFNSDALRFISNFVPMVIVMPFGPLIYFYIRSVVDPSFTIAKQQRVHFLPVIIDIVPQLAVIIFIVGVFAGAIKNNPGPWGNFIDTYNTYADIPRWMSVSFYVVLSAKYLSALKAKNKGVLNGQAINFKWLQQFIRVFLVFQVLWFIFLVPYVIPKYYDALMNTVDWYPIYVPLAVMIYWLGIKGYLVSQQDNASLKKAATSNSALTAAVIHQTIASLKKAMEEDRLYLNSNLNLNMLAQHTNLTQKIISAVLNQHVHKSFNEFVNEYRVAAFKEKIQLQQMENFTIAGIAYECGFNSQATFQRTFKEATGTSPSEFRKRVLEIQ